jgi:hypothetical protein
MNQQAPGFEQDIRPLFRGKDIESMMFALDLSSYEDVRANAEGIYAHLADGSMPCDEAWPADRVTVFHDWMDAGFPE